MYSLTPPKVGAFTWPCFPPHRPARDAPWSKPYLELLKDLEDGQDGDDEEMDEASSGSDTDNSEEEEGNEPESSAALHPVRRFMSFPRLDGGGSEQRHLDEEEVVSSFCEQVSCDTGHAEAPYIAIIDIRSNVGVGSDGLGFGVPRDQRGGRTANQLREDLEFWVGSGFRPGFTLDPSGY